MKELRGWRKERFRGESDDKDFAAEGTSEVVESQSRAREQ